MTSDPLQLEAISFLTSGVSEDEWRNNATLRAEARASGQELIAKLERIGITLQTGRATQKTALRDFCDNLRTHPARPAYDPAEIEIGLPKQPEGV